MLQKCPVLIPAMEVIKTKRCQDHNTQTLNQMNTEETSGITSLFLLHDQCIESVVGPQLCTTTDTENCVSLWDT